MQIREMVSLRGQKMVMNLIVMNMSDFDVIFDLNFLNRYGAEIDYIKKMVQFNLDSGE